MAKAKSRAPIAHLDSADNANSPTIADAHFSNNDQIPGDTTHCGALNRGGSRCKARSLIGGNYCSIHSDPGRAAALGSKGGHRRAIFDPENLKEFEPPKTAADLLVLIAQSIVDARSGQLDPRVAWVISHLSTNFLRALELSVLERKVAQLEDRHNEAPEAGGTANLLPPVYDTVFQKLEERNKTLKEGKQ